MSRDESREKWGFSHSYALRALVRGGKGSERERKGGESMGVVCQAKFSLSSNFNTYQILRIVKSRNCANPSSCQIFAAPQQNITVARTCAFPSFALRTKKRATLSSDSILYYDLCCVTNTNSFAVLNLCLVECKT